MGWSSPNQSPQTVPVSSSTSVPCISQARASPSALRMLRIYAELNCCSRHLCGSLHAVVSPVPRVWNGFPFNPYPLYGESVVLELYEPVNEGLGFDESCVLVQSLNLFQRLSVASLPSNSTSPYFSSKYSISTQYPSQSLYWNSTCTTPCDYSRSSFPSYLRVRSDIGIDSPRIELNLEINFTETLRQGKYCKDQIPSVILIVCGKTLPEVGWWQDPVTRTDSVQTAAGYFRMYNLPGAFLGRGSGSFPSTRQSGV